MLKKPQQTKIIKRLNKISGQINGIKKMVIEPRYCIDILNQISAAKAALESTGKFILEDHIKTCVYKSMRKGKGTKEIKELIDVFEKF